MDFEDLLNESVRLHGHLCAGQVLGVRMSVLGLREAGIVEPKGANRKNLMVFVEIDRCATDAIQSVTGCSLGKRTMKFMDYGKMAATFVNLKKQTPGSEGEYAAVRVLAKEESRQLAKAYFPNIENRYEAQLEAYKVMPEHELFEVSEVIVKIRPEDMPGRPSGRVTCAVCGEYVQDSREVTHGDINLCRPCSTEAGYYEGPFFSSSVMHKLHNDFEIKSKLWIESGGGPFFGRGKVLLLKAIDRHGSISQAAKEVNIPYRKAWGYIKAMEERLGIPLVECKAGGKNGGGATLTPEIRDFLAKYDRIEKEMRLKTDEKFREIFGL
jgi:formylmethanofuran dehydrogenase subunit E